VGLRDPALSGVGNDRDGNARSHSGATCAAQLTGDGVDGGVVMRPHAYVPSRDRGAPAIDKQRFRVVVDDVGGEGGPDASLAGELPGEGSRHNPRLVSGVER